jgi:hypothetical protein
MYCTACGTQLDGESLICLLCGRAIVVSTDAHTVPPESTRTSLVSGQAAAPISARERSVGLILADGFRVLRQHGPLLALPALLCFSAFPILDELASRYAPVDPEDPSGERLQQAVLDFTHIIAYLIASPAISVAFGSVISGRRVSVLEALGASVRLMPRVFAAVLLSILPCVLGMMLLIVPGIYLVIALSLFTQVIVFERARPIGALRASLSLMQGNILRGLAILLVGGLGTLVLDVGVELTLGSIPVIGPLAVLGSYAIGFTYFEVVRVLLYVDIRVRNETLVSADDLWIEHRELPASPAGA